MTSRLLLAACLAALACAPPLPGRLVRLIATAPQGTVAPDAVQVAITFDGPLASDGILDGRFFALCPEEDQAAVVAQAEAEGGLDAAAPVVPARRSLEAGGARAVLTPLQPLTPERAFVAVLSRRARAADGRAILDAAGKARTIVVAFATGPAPDRAGPRPRWVLPPHGPVPFDLAALAVGFDEPVEGALALAAGQGDPAALGPALLGLALAAPLAPGPLALDLSAVRDAAGNPAAPLAPLTVSTCGAGGPPAVGAPTLTPGRLAVRIEAPLRGMGRLVAELSSRAGEPACGAAPASPATAEAPGEVQACPGWDPCRPAAVSCPGAVAASLCAGRAVRARLASQDLAGRRGAAGAWFEVAALPPAAQPVLTEALADAEAPEAGGEYAEVANLGTGPADLAGWSLAKRTASGTWQRCTLVARGGGPVAAGAYGLVVGGAYDGRYALPPGTALYGCGATALDGGLANDRALVLALEDPQGAAVSTLGVAEPAPRCAQGALERVHPAGPDAASDLACPGARTPGACNASTPPAECPRPGE